MIQEELKFEIYEAELLDPLGGYELSELERYVASLLLDARGDRPVGIREIIDRRAALTGRRVSEREVKKVIRSLRKDHKFPILARRKPPAGYWWCSSTEEMEQFIASFRSQALDELHTLSQIVKHNFPALAGQITLEDAR